MAKALSLTRKAKSLIRREIGRFYGPAATGSRKSALEAMHDDAEAYNCGTYKRNLSDWQLGVGLVNAGCFRCYHSDQADFLKKIYGKQVHEWEGERIHKTYANLIGREYASMIREKRNATLKTKQGCEAWANSYFGGNGKMPF